MCDIKPFDKRELVSVVIPVYNVESYLSKCLDSLVNQSYKNIDVILVDDGSTDTSPIICDNYSAKYPNINVIHQKNAGVSAARNKGIDSANGKYIYFVDPDDWCELDAIEVMYNSLVESKVDLAYCGMFINKSNNIEITPPRLKNQFKKYQQFGNSGCQYIVDISESLPLHLFGNFASGLYRGMFRRDLIEKYNIRFDVNVWKAEDWLFYTQYLSHCKKEIIIDKPLYHYFQREGSLINTYYEETDNGIRKGQYILHKFEAILVDAGIPKEWYKVQLSQRYIQSILRYSINIWDFRNKRKSYGKYKKIRTYNRVYAPYSNIDANHLTLLQRMMLKTKSALLLSLYGIVFNTAKKLKQKAFAFINH